MPVTPTYPGVYIEEIPSGVRTITGVSTSVTAFVGYFTRGPLDTAVRLHNLGDFEREHGGLNARDETGYATQQFFANGGTSAWAVRVASSDTVALAPAEVTLPDADGTAVLRVCAGRQVRGRSVTDPGTWGNELHVDVDHNTRDMAATDQFNVTVSEVASVDGRRVVLRSETFANCSTSADSRDYAVSKINDGSTMVQVEAIDSSTRDLSARPAQTGTTGGPVAAVTFTPTSTVDVNSGGGPHVVTLSTLAGDTTWDTGAARIRAALEEGIRVAGRTADDPYLSGATVTVQGNVLHVAAGGRTRADFDPDTVLTFTSASEDLGLEGGTTAVQQYRLNGGADGDVPDADALRGSFAAKTGMYALRDVDLFSILVLPSAAALEDTAAHAVYTEAATFCEQERAFLIVDVPTKVDEGQDAIDWVDPLRHRNAAVYFPRVRIPDPLDDNRLRSVGTSGTMAGVYARTDGERGVWKAPAGLDAVLRNVQDFDVTINDADNGVLNQVAVNALRRFPIYGRVAWGARTLEGADARASEWKYVPVRRFTLFLEESLYRGMQWAVFEPNDHGLWAQIRLNVGAFMHNLFRQGAFQGTSPRDAYFVKCDAETTTQNDIDRGIVNVLVGFAPLKPAEFVIIQIQQMAGQIQT
jgi:Bacteriophage tail sheath protein